MWRNWWRRRTTANGSLTTSATQNAASSDGQATAAGWQTCVLALLSSLLLEIAAADGQPRAEAIALRVGVQAVLLAAAHALCRRWARARSAPATNAVATQAPPSEFLIPLIIALALLPFGIEAVSRLMLSSGSAFELVLLEFMRNLVLGIAAASVWPSYQKTATGISVLLAIFASSVGNDRAMIVLLALYAIVGMWWLMGMYWGRLAHHLHATHERAMPRRWLVLLPLLVLLLTIAIGSQAPRTTAASLTGFSPVSGGTRWYDEFARGGIGDGDALVNGTTDASTFGPVESDLFLESEETSLYDAFSDTYGEPLRKPKNGRAIALPPSLVKELEQRMAQSKQAQREFSTVRQMTTQRRELSDIQSPALLYVMGRGPLHLRMETFDVFDGQDWFPTEKAQASTTIKLVQRDSKPWIALDDFAPSNDVYDGGEQHVIKVTGLKTDRLPLPTNSVAFHIDRVDQPAFFDWVQDGVVRFQSDEGVPPLTVLHAFSRVVDEPLIRRLRESEIMSRSERLAPLPIDRGTQAMAALAEQWAGHLPRDWRRVDAVVAKLRSEYVHERAAERRQSVSFRSAKARAFAEQKPTLGTTDFQSVDAEGRVLKQEDERRTGSPSYELDNAVAEFVLSQRRGPDYLFASAACLMLRQLGFTTRLASGFYVDPQKYDLKRRHIPVSKDDVHFWCEVYLSARTWVPIEPTPGYERLAPPLSVWARCVLVVIHITAWSLAHAAELAVLGVVLAALWWWRWSLVDALVRASWLVRSMSERDRVLAVHQLLLRRSKWSGLPKPEWMSARKWYAKSLPHDRDCELLDQWSRFVDWACFAPANWEPPPNVKPLSTEVLKRWSLQRMKVGGPTSGRGISGKSEIDHHWGKPSGAGCSIRDNRMDDVNC